MIWSNPANRRRLIVARRFLSTREIFELAPCIIIGAVLKAGKAEELTQAFVLEHLDHFSWLVQECSSLAPVEEDSDDLRFVVCELGMESDVVLPYPF